MNKNFALNILVSSTFILCIYGIIVFYFYGNKHSGNWAYSYLIEKYKYANNDNRKKIVFIGGSNVLFGINTKKIEKEFSIKTVNFGITAGLKTDYYLHIAKKVANTNDIIITPFEYENYTWDNESIETRQLFLFSYDKEYLISQGLVHLFKEIYSVPILDLIKNLYKDKLLYNKIKINNNYKNLRINTNGDIIFEENSEIINRVDLQFDISSKFHETYALKKIKEFNSYARKNNIKFYVSYPNIVTHKDYYTTKYIDYFNNLKKYFDDNNINIIGTPEMAMYDYNDTYDARYHLNKNGIKKRTNNFIKHIKEEIIQ